MSRVPEKSITHLMEALNIDVPDPNLFIIAVKGHPFTRKTEFAETVASFLRCPILSSEHFLRYLTPPLSPEREFEAFRVICDIAFHQLHKGTSKYVVIDSPLSSKSHLIHLTHLAFKLDPMQLRVIIIECKPMHHYSWKLKLEQHLVKCPPMSEEWYKPKNWGDVEKAIKDNPDYDIDMSVPGHKFVSKLVVDPIMDYPVRSTSSSNFREYHVKPLKTPHLVEAVKYMMTRNLGNSVDVVVYRQWLQQWLQQSQNKSSSPFSFPREKMCSRDGHNIVPYSAKEEGPKHEVTDCNACKKQVTKRENYCYCKNCNLALHMECAEAFDDNKSCQRFSKEFACNPCIESGKHFSDQCMSCLFETHLKRRLMPTIIKHFDTEEHFLTILLKPNQLLDADVCRCVACGHKDRYNMYICKDCGFAYHLKCVTMPRQVKDVHGGHHHHLLLKFKSDEAEDYICQECQELRDPSLWFYSCQDCSGYELHPSCVHTVKQLYPLLQVRREADRSAASLVGLR